MYLAHDNQVFYCHPNEEGRQELFLTVHPTKDCTESPEQQAKIIADLLNTHG